MTRSTADRFDPLLAWPLHWTVAEQVADFSLNRPQVNIQGEDMTPLQAAARFAAYVWYMSNRDAPRRVVREEAKRFSRENWKVFVPVANEGLGRLLIEVSRGPSPTSRDARIGRQKRQMEKRATLMAAN